MAVEASPPHRWSDLKTRIISGVLLATLALALTIAHPLSFAVLVLAACVQLARESATLTLQQPKLRLGLMLYIVAAAASLIYLRLANLNILLAVFAIVWGSDIAAYFVGKMMGKHKIAPAISPGKSWEGLAGAVIAAAFISAQLGWQAPVVHAILGAVLAVVGLLGDLFESWLKRRAGVKDSGTLIPGHGGAFDRLDALLPCAILSALALYARTAAL